MSEASKARRDAGVVRMDGIARLLRPGSIALVGASATPGSFGASVQANLEAAGYAGELHLVNPKRASIGERACVATVDELPEGVDCAVLVIPRAGVLEALEACARRRVGSAIVFSGGFAETGAEGLAEQKRMRAIAEESGMVVEGPNCLGMVNYVDGIPLTFVVTPMDLPERERLRGKNGIAVVSQSGAMAAVLGVSLRSHGLGISYSVSTGNEAASGVEDFVEYMIADEHTRVIAMIVEQFRSPRRFMELARRARRAGKQIVLLHPGSSGAARASAATHTGALAGDYQVMRTKVEHAGVLVVETLEELVDVADLLVRCPSLPAGGAAVFTESGAFKAMTLDFCERVGLELPALSERTAESLRQVLPVFIPPTNPLDITAQGLIDPELYRRTLPPVLADDAYGSVVLSIILTDETTSALKFPPILDSLREIRPTKPVIFAAMDDGAKFDPKYAEQLRELGVPFYPSTERAFRALASVTKFAGRQRESAPERGDKVEEVAAAAVAVAALPSGVIPEHRSKEILARAGIRVPEGALARTLEEAQTIAARLGVPVALKAQSSRLSHKSDVGGVALNLRDAAAVAEAWRRMHVEIAAAMPGMELDGVLVEAMGERGAELIVGVRNDPEWGPVVLVGFGGVLAEALQDVRLLAPELGRAAIERELLQLKSAALLRGFRGSPELDVRAAAEIVARVGRLALASPRIREIDINPVVVYPKGLYAKGQGAVALDALMVVE